MKIIYKKKKTLYYIIVGFLWLSLGFAGVWFEFPKWQTYLQIVIGVIYIVIGIFEKREQYVCMQKGYIEKGRFPFWKLDLDKVIAIKETRSGFELKTQEKTYKIQATNLDSESLQKLKEELKKINVEDNPLR